MRQIVTSVAWFGGSIVGRDRLDPSHYVQRYKNHYCLGYMRSAHLLHVYPEGRPQILHQNHANKHVDMAETYSADSLSTRVLSPHGELQTLLSCLFTVARVAIVINIDSTNGPTASHTSTIMPCLQRILAVFIALLGLSNRHRQEWSAMRVSHIHQSVGNERTWPFRYWQLAQKRTAAAMSLSFPGRWEGNPSLCSFGSSLFWLSLLSPVVISLGKTPGAMLFPLILNPAFAISADSILLRWTCAPLDAL